MAKRRFEYCDVLLKRKKPGESLRNRMLQCMDEKGNEGWRCIIIDPEIVDAAAPRDSTMKWGRRLYFEREKSE